MSTVSRKFVPMLGERLKKVREELGLSQTQFAERCGITMRSQRNYEKGERQPDAGVLLCINQEFGIDVTWLVTGMSSQPIPPPQLKPDEAALLDNYRNASKEQKNILKVTSAAFAQSKQAVKKKA